MQCTNCGTTLPPGVATCPNCGIATPYNAFSSGSPSQYEPTVYSPPPQFGATPSPNAGNPAPIEPTVVASQYNGTPPTAYGTPEAPPPPPGQNPYQQNPVNPYNAPPSPQYGAPPMQQGAYIPPPQVGGYGYSTPPPKKRSRVGLIVGIVLLVVVLACVGISALVYNGIKQGVSSVTATVTASVATVTSVPNTPTAGQATSPSGQPVDPTAAGIITNIQTASDVDQNSAKPTKLATTFTVQQPIYSTVDLHMNGQTGYIEAKWYADGSFVFTSKILSITDPTSAHAFFGATYKVATQGAVEIYFCTQSDCSDAKLAAVANFTVTSSGLHWQNQPPLAMMDINRP